MPGGKGGFDGWLSSKGGFDGWLGGKGGSDGWLSGKVARNSGKYGFILQDHDGSHLFVLPTECKAFGGDVPPEGTRVMYSQGIDPKTNKDRAENVKLHPIAPMEAMLRECYETHGIAGCYEAAKGAMAAKGACSSKGSMTPMMASMMATKGPMTQPGKGPAGPWGQAQQGSGAWEGPWGWWEKMMATSSGSWGPQGAADSRRPPAARPPSPAQLQPVGRVHHPAGRAAPAPAPAQKLPVQPSRARPTQARHIAAAQTPQESPRASQAPPLQGAYLKSGAPNLAVPKASAKTRKMERSANVIKASCYESTQEAAPRQPARTPLPAPSRGGAYAY